MGVAIERQEQLQRAEECHRFYQDLADSLTLIQVRCLSTHHIHTHIQCMYVEVSPSHCRSDRRAFLTMWPKICGE